MHRSRIPLLSLLATILVAGACERTRTCLDDSACLAPDVCLGNQCVAPVRCNSDDDCSESHPRCRAGGCASLGPDEGPAAVGPVPPPNVEDPGVGDAGAGAVTVDAGPDDAGVCVPLVELSTPVGESTLPFWLVIGQGLAGLYFRPDGTAAYLCETLSDRCATLLLSAAWDVTGGVTVVEGPALGDSYPADVFFKPDGARLFLIGSGADRLYQFDLAVPWELGSAQAAGSVAFPLETAARSVFFRPDGGRVYLSGLASDRIFQYDLAIPWDVTSMEGANPVGSLSVVPSMVNPGVSDLHLDETGSTLHWSREGEGVYQAALSMPWDIESASAPVSVLVDTWMQGTSPRGLWVSNDHVYLLDPEGQRLRQLTRASCP